MIPKERAQLIYDNLETVRGKIEQAAVRSGRNPAEIEMIIVTKTWSPEIIASVIEKGVRQLGENRIQEALPKIEQLKKKYKNLTWHMIGHLQSNKARKAVENFKMIQSVDSFKIARRISDIAVEMNKTTDVLIEINISQEVSKYGVQPSEVMQLAEKVVTLPGVHLRGLMTIGPLTADADVVRRAFQKTRQYFEDLRRNIPGKINTLSMGMSDDYETAIEEGATMVRIGRAVFGNRRN